MTTYATQFAYMEVLSNVYENQGTYVEAQLKILSTGAALPGVNVYFYRCQSTNNANAQYLGSAVTNGSGIAHFPFVSNANGGYTWHYFHAYFGGAGNYANTTSVTVNGTIYQFFQTSITLNCAYSSPLYVGNPITFSGTLQTTTGVKLSGKAIDIYFNQTNQDPFAVWSAVATTNASGNWSVTVNFTPNATGTWYFAAHWAGDAAHNLCWSTHSSLTEQAVPPPPMHSTNLSCYVTNANPQVGTSIGFYGYLTDANTSAAISGALVTLKANGTTVANGYTDTNGLWSVNVYAVSGTNQYQASFTGDSTHYASSSGIVAVTGSAAVVDATVTLTKIGIEAKPNSVIFYDMGTPIVVNAECGPVDPTVNIGVAPTVVAAECAPVITDVPPANAYPDILAQQEYVFPPVVQPECSPNSMAVTQLSTSVLPTVVQPEAFTENYCEVDTTAQGNAGIIGAECSVINPHAVISYPLLLEVDAVISEDLVTSALIEDTVYLGVKIKKDIELALEVTTE